MQPVQDDQPLQSAVDTKKTEEAMRQIQLVVDNSYDALIGETFDGIVTTWNKGATRMFGYTSNEMIGKSVMILLPPEMKNELPPQLQKIKKGEVVIDYDTIRVRKNGTQINVAISMSPMVDETGTLFGVSVVERDISVRKKSEESMRQIQLVVDNSYDALIGETLDGIVTTWSNGASRMFGLTSQEMIGKSINLIVPEEFREEVRAVLGKIRKGEVVADHDSVRIRKDGLKIYVSVTIAPIINKDGVIAGASVVVRDITDRKKAEKEAVDAKEFLDNVINTNRDSFFVKDSNSVFVLVNDAMCEMLGLTRKEIIGKTLNETLPPNQTEGFVKVDKMVLETGVSSSIEEILTGAGNKLLNIITTKSRYIDQQGKKFIIGTIHDITKLKQAQEKELESTKKFETYTQKAPLGIFICDTNGQYTDANLMALNMTGYTKEELLKISIKDFLAPEALAEGLKGFGELMKTGSTQGDLLVHKKTGEKFWIRLSGVKIDDNTVIAFCEDITERKTSEKHILELNEIRNKFIEIMSHQLRTPLTSINWSLESILNGDYGKLEDVQQKFLQATHSASIEITKRIGNLLSAIDIEEGRMKYEMDDVDLTSLCAGIANEAAKKCVLKDLIFSYIPPTNTIPVFKGDNEKIRIAINMFLENAIGYTKEKGKVTMTLVKNGDAVRLEVIDTGIGIPKGEQSRVFSRFFRASNSSTMETDAFGIGLFIAKNFIEQHKGTIGFESIEGQGSTFWFTLPIK